MTVKITQAKVINVSDIIARSEYKNKPVSATHQLKRFIELSELVRVGKVDDVVCCVWGLIPPSLLSNKAYLWLITTDQLTEHQFVLVRHSQIEIARLLEEYEVIIGHCSVGQPKSIRWLRWLGAEFFDIDALGRLPFEIRRR